MTRTLAFLAIFYPAIVWGVVLGLILGAFVVSALSSNVGSIRRFPSQVISDWGNTASGVNDLGGSAVPTDERIRPIARMSSHSKEQSVSDIIRQAALEFSQSPDELLAVAKCESSLRPALYGDGGAALGLFQWHLGTWLWLAPNVGYTTDLRADPVAAARATAWAFTHGYAHLWTCYAGERQTP